MLAPFLRTALIATACNALLFVGLAFSAMAQIPAVDWKAQQAETLRHYRALVQIDTSSPPGNETAVVNYLKNVFEAEGIPVKTFALQPARANLVARIKGNGSKRPVLIMAHTDVVGVQREKWPVDPFGAVVKDGYIWGRGTKDDKDKLTANLMTMLLAKRLGAPLDRDLIFLAEVGRRGRSRRGGHQFHGERALRRDRCGVRSHRRWRRHARRWPRYRRQRPDHGESTSSGRGWSRTAPPGTDRFLVSTTRSSICRRRLPKWVLGKRPCD